MKPIILIPGMFGSILENEKHESVWPGDSMQYFKDFKNNIIDNLAGTTDSDYVFKNWVPQDIRARQGIPGVSRLLDSQFLQIFKVKTLDYYVDIIKALEKIGYVQDETLFAYPYDFRQSFVQEKIMQEFAAFLKTFKEKPLIIAHSMGGLLVRYFQHEYEDWFDYFDSLISVNVCYDGGNGIGIMNTVDGYDMGASVLKGCTAAIYSSSGITSNIFGCATSKMPTQCLYFLKNKKPAESMLLEESTDIWDNVIIEQEPSHAYLVALNEAKLNKSVTYNISYWVNRFAQLFPKEITLSTAVVPAKPLPYCDEVHTQADLFIGQELKIKESIDSGECTLIEAMMWGESEKFPFDIHRDRNYYPMQNTLFENEGIDFVVGEDLPELAKQSGYKELLGFEPVCNEQMSLLDFYDRYCPDGTIEGILFKVNYELFKKHQEVRNRPIQWHDQFKFASISCYGIPTPRDCYYDEPVNEIYELRFKEAKPIYTEGDGTVILVSQLDDCVDQKCVISRKSFKGISHKGVLYNEKSISEIMRLVQIMQ